MQITKPKTLPLVRPVPEYQAKGELKEVYEDLKKVLGVPWVGVITQALAFYEPFFKEAWSQLKPSLNTNFFEDSCNEIRLHSWNKVSKELNEPHQVTKLKAHGYKDKEIEEIRETLDVLDYGNSKYLVFATVVKDALVNGKLEGNPRTTPDILSPRPPVKAGNNTLVMVEEHHASEGLMNIYKDIKKTLDLPFINSDYKAQARWPSYLEIAWHELKPFINTPNYNSLRGTINNMGYELARNLPSPYSLDTKQSINLGMDIEEIDELIEVITLFQYLLSGLIINVSFFKASISSR